MAKRDEIQYSTIPVYGAPNPGSERFPQPVNPSEPTAGMSWPWPDPNTAIVAKSLDDVVRRLGALQLNTEADRAEINQIIGSLRTLSEMLK